MSHFTRKQLNGIYKDISTNQEKSKMIYKFKCHCDSMYIDNKSQRFHIRRDQRVTKSLRT